MKQHSRNVSAVLRLISVLLVLLTSPANFAQSDSPVPRLAADPSVAALAGLGEPMDIDTLIDLSLTASGVNSTEREFYARQISELTGNSPRLTGDVAVDGENLLLWMHEEILDRYVEPQTKIDVLLENGTYNCVSSAVLYLILARAAGIPVYGVQTADHAFCRVPDAGDEEGGYDVETTIPYGFDPGRRHDAVDSFSGRTGFIYVPPSNYRSRNEIGEKDLISLVYQNRIAALQRSRKWTEAVGLARDRWELSGSDSARRDFVVSLDNYAAEMDRQRQHEDGLTILYQASEILGEKNSLYDSARALVHNAVTLSLRAGDIQQAREILADDENTALLKESDIQSLAEDIENSALDLVVKSGDFTEASLAVDAALAEGLISRSRWETLVNFLWSNEARRISGNGNWLEGWYFLTGSPSEVQQVLEEKGVTGTYRYNVVVTFHNSIVSHLRAGRLDEAEALLDEAEGMFPGERSLASDRSSLDQLRSRE